MVVVVVVVVVVEVARVPTPFSDRAGEPSLAVVMPLSAGVGVVVLTSLEWGWGLQEVEDDEEEGVAAAAVVIFGGRSSREFMIRARTS